MEELEKRRQDFTLALQQVYGDNKFKEVTTIENLDTYVEDKLELLEACQRRVRPSPDMMGIERSACSLCPKLCEAYEPFEVFVLEMTEKMYSNQFVPSLCRNCKCPAYFHDPIIRPLVFPNYLREGLRKYMLKEDHLNYQGIICVFEINYLNIDGQKVTLKGQEDDLYLALQHGGFRVISRAVKILSKEESQQLNLTDSKTVTGPFQPLQKMSSTVFRTSTLIQDINRSRITVMNEKLNDPCLLLCLSSTNYTNSQVQFSKFIRAAAGLIPQAIKLIYSSKNSTQGLTDTCMFFPEVFSIKHSCLLIMTEEESQKQMEELDPVMSFFKKQSMKIKGKSMIDDEKNPNMQNIGRVMDMLNFNGYVQIGKVDKKVENQFELEEVISKIMPKGRSGLFLKFLLSNAQESKIQAFATGKAGMPLLLTLNPFSIETFSFTSEKETQALFKYFFPQLSSTSRTVIVFRPITVKSGLNKVLINIFKSNFFVTIRELYKKLNTEEAKFLLRSSINLTPESEQDYLNCMLDGETHIVVMSKFGAVENANILVDGCKFGRKRTEKRLLGVEKLNLYKKKEFLNPFNMKLDEDEGVENVQEERYTKEEIITIRNNGENNLFTLSPFTSINELIDLDAITEIQIKDTEHNSDLPNFYTRQRESEILKEFSRTFNILIDSSETADSAEKTISRFFPDLQNYSEIILSFKPEAISLTDDAIDLIKNMQFRIIKHYVASETNQYLFISKKAAFEEVNSAMKYKSFVTSPLGPQHMSELFDLVEGSQNKQDIIRVIAPNLVSFSGEILLQAPDIMRNEILRYCSLVTIGEEIAMNTVIPVQISSDFPHISYKMRTNEDLIEIRIRRLGSQEGRDSLESRIGLINEYEITKWFYTQIRISNPEIVPSFFEYKIEPNDPDSDMTRVFTTEQYKGDVFLYEVSETMKTHRDRERSRIVHRAVMESARGSMPAFMWGRKLAKLVENIEKLRCDSIEDCGPLYWNGKGEILG